MAGGQGDVLILSSDSITLGETVRINGIGSHVGSSQGSSSLYINDIFVRTFNYEPKEGINDGDYYDFTPEEVGTYTIYTINTYANPSNTLTLTVVESNNNIFNNLIINNKTVSEITNNSNNKIVDSIIMGNTIIYQRPPQSTDIQYNIRHILEIPYDNDGLINNIYMGRNNADYMEMDISEYADTLDNWQVDIDGMCICDVLSDYEESNWSNYLENHPLQQFMADYYLDNINNDDYLEFCGTIEDACIPFFSYYDSVTGAYITLNPTIQNIGRETVIRWALYESEAEYITLSNLKPIAVKVKGVNPYDILDVKMFAINKNNDALLVGKSIPKRSSTTILLSDSVHGLSWDLPLIIYILKESNLMDVKLLNHI